MVFYLFRWSSRCEGCGSKLLIVSQLHSLMHPDPGRIADLGPRTLQDRNLCGLFAPIGRCSVSETSAETLLAAAGLLYHWTASVHSFHPHVGRDDRYDEVDGRLLRLSV